MAERFVLDAWALLAYLQREEPAASRVVDLLRLAERGQVALLISIINLGEAYYRIGKARGAGEADAILQELRRLPLEVLEAGEEAVLAAARLKMRLVISYADAFAAAEAMRHEATLLTGDPELIRLEGMVWLEKLSR